jgi:hypothetical protein
MKKKISGAEMLSELAALGTEASVLDRKVPAASTVAEEADQKSGRRVGRPAKVGLGATAVNLRLSAEQHADLGRMAPELMEAGKPMPNIQDIVRWLIDGARRDPALLLELVRKGGRDHG